jgi:hypothetical protein
MTDLLETAQRQWDQERCEHELTSEKLKALEKDYDAALIELDQVQAQADSMAVERDILHRRNAMLEAQLKQIATACDGSIHMLAQLGRDALTASTMPTPARPKEQPPERSTSAIVKEAFEMPMFLQAAANVEDRQMEMLRAPTPQAHRTPLPLVQPL